MRSESSNPASSLRAGFFMPSVPFAARESGKFGCAGHQESQLEPSNKKKLSESNVSRKLTERPLLLMGLSSKELPNGTHFNALA